MTLMYDRLSSEIVSYALTEAYQHKFEAVYEDLLTSHTWQFLP
jgi:hypothetical protein